MRNVRVDADGELRCWKCGGKNFSLKRTARSKVLVGVGALATKKKLKCQQCGEYNDVGNAKPFTERSPNARLPTEATVGATNDARWDRDPTGRHDLRYWNGVSWTEHVSTAGHQSVDAIRTPSAGVADELRKLAELHDTGVLSGDEFARQKARLLDAGA